MKKSTIWCIVILLVLALAAGAVAVFWDPILDALPIDQSGWNYDDDGNSYYHDEDGDPITGWQELDGIRYYFHPGSGIMATGWLNLDDGRYYLDSNGFLQTGWHVIDGKTYCLDDSGKMRTGWVDSESGSVYLGENGNPYSGWLNTEEGRCFLDNSGLMCRGWITTTEGTFYLNDSGYMATGWITVGDDRYYLNENGNPATGWIELDGTRFYLQEDGTTAQGWQTIDDRNYYLNEDGSSHTGWLEQDGVRYYLKEDGTMARGKVMIGDQPHYFTSTGANIILVNPWNFLPDDYEVELIELDDGRLLEEECYNALMKMLEDCKAAGHKPYLYSTYRTQAQQQGLFDKKVREHNGNKEKAAQIVAVPGTSEHQMGIAVDITDSNYRKLNYDQEKTKTQQWLMANCWDYGFIVRYPSGSSDITGIIYEPWHYRYVGLELAQELKELGICLEEYLDMLTEDGTTCGNPNYTPKS